MPLFKYGLLKGKVFDVRPVNSNDQTPHYEVHIKASDKDYRIAINVASQESPSEVLYYVSENFNSEQITNIPKLEEGFTQISNDNQKIALDYIRGGLFDPTKMIPLPATENGPNNDLNEKVSNYINEAKNKNATVYAYGEKFKHENKKDKYFGFSPGRGIHDIHMNQGNSPKWKSDDGIWQDGGILIHFEEENRWVGMFLAFQSQSWCTDDKGHATKPVGECNHTNAPSIRNL
ncbi:MULTISPECIES: YukJ family protein [Priestia]|uniref:YukJ family protein n=1 Tax=Priestia TaxID=2800373 RepID=UPI001C8DB85F|nr:MULTISPECIES: YukJ family protein [Priestia]MBX9985528.1 YukJ family protein [Priestia aryabhattai]UYV55650.1 YukJ family protein [Priestia megaterium]